MLDGGELAWARGYGSTRAGGGVECRDARPSATMMRNILQHDMHQRLKARFVAIAWRDLAVALLAAILGRQAPALRPADGSS